MSDDFSCLDRSGTTRHNSLRRIDTQFNVSGSIRTLQELMRSVTDKELSAETVNAACNCVSQINSTMKTAIMAAKYLSDR